MNAFSWILIICLLVVSAGFMVYAINDNTDRLSWVARCIIEQSDNSPRMGMRDLCWAKERNR